MLTKLIWLNGPIILLLILNVYFQEFYSKKAARQGKFRKGGIPDANAAARGLIEDWNR